MTNARADSRLLVSSRGRTRPERAASKANIDIVNAIIVGGLAVLVVCLRPSAIGEIYSFQVSVLMAVLVAAYIAFNRSKLIWNPPSLAVLQIILTLIVIFQVSIQAAIAGGIFAVDAPKALAMSLITTAALMVAISTRRNSTIFFSTLCGIILLMCASTVVSSLLMAVGFQWTSLIVGHNDQTVYGDLKILFPYTLSFNLFPTPFGVMPRLSGFFREPGIFPPFACWAAAYAHMRRWPLSLSLVALAASVASLSTLGAPLAAFTGALILLRRTGMGTWPALGVLAGMAVFSWPILYGLEHIGLRDKILSQAGSYEARRDAITTAWSASNMVFGDGPSLGYATDATVNLIGRIRSIGVIGFGFVLAAHALPFWKDIFIIGAIPMVATCLITQPIAGDPAVFAVCLSWTAFAQQRLMGGRRHG